MALKGTLKDFGISEILQMIGTQKKTGLLVIEDTKRKAKAQVEFTEGMIVNAEGGEITPGFGERIFKGGFITKEQYLALEKQAKETLKPLPLIVISSGIMDQEAVKRLYIRQMSEIVYEIFDWHTGTYEFNQKFVQWDKQYVTPIPAEGIMMEGLRITDEGPSVKRNIPSLDEVFVRNDHTSVEIDAMDDGAKVLFRNLDGVRTLKEIILASNQDRFDAMKSLSWLRANGYIVVKKIEPQKVKTPAPYVPQKLNYITLAALYLLLGICLSGLLFKAGTSLWSFAAPLAHEEGQSAPLSEMLGEARLNKVRNALEVYYLRTGKYPDSLRELIDAGLVESGDIDPLGHKPYSYSQIDSGAAYLLGDETLPPSFPEETKPK